MTRIYFDNASTTPLHPEVAKWMYEMSLEEYGNPSSIHFFGRKAKSLVENARKTISKLIKASIGEIYFTSSATEANNMVLKNAVEYLGINHIITSPTEHPCVLQSVAYIKQKYGTKVTFLPVDQTGLVDMDVLQQILSQDTDEKKLLSLMHGNNETGTMIDLQKVSAICLDNKTLFHCDTVQTLGKMPIDVSSTYLSFLSGSAHKFHGPKGVGFVYINQNNIIPPYIHGGAQERNMRAGTENVISIGGMAKAFEIANENMDQNRNHILQLRDYFKKGLVDKFEDIRFNGEQEGLFLAHILNVSFPPGPKADLLVHNLDIAGICCSSASACSSGVEADSHVLKAIRHNPERKAIRFSFSVNNTLEEVDYVLTKLENITPLRS